MKKIILYIAASLNGKIARNDGSVDWLESIPNPEKTDHGYSAFYDSIDTTIMGSKTYQQIIDWDIPFPYPDKTNYVITRKRLKNTKQVEFITENHLDYIHNLKKQSGKDIWLIGGGQINTFLFNASLIDEIRLFIMPLVIEDGIELFESMPQQKYLELLETKNYSTGAVELRYKIK